MTKKEIVRSIARQTGLPPHDIKRIVQETFDAIIDVLAEDGRLELRNFGIFQVKERAARKARNPMTGKEVRVPQRFVVTFKPGLIMQQKVAAIDPAKAAKWDAADAGSHDAAGEDGDDSE